MKRNTLLISIAMIVIGYIAARVGDSMSTVVQDEAGRMMVQDSMLMPIGAVLIIVGLLALVAAVLWYFVDFVKGRAKN